MVLIMNRFSNTEVVLSTFQGPKKIAFGCRIGVGKFSVCKDNLQLLQFLFSQSRSLIRHQLTSKFCTLSAAQPYSFDR